MQAAIYTLGCKVNQYETQAMEQELRRPMMLLVSARKRTAWPHGKPGRRDGPG